jgi:phosphohistidine phosphatase
LKLPTGNYYNFEQIKKSVKMKTIYVIRHAKSSWDAPNLTDHERPLIDKGIQRTALVTGFLVKHNIKIGLIISSDAVRAFETAKLIAAAIGYPIGNIKTDRRIYQESLDSVYKVISEVSPKIDSIMIVGHNPTLTNFVNDFLEEEIDELPTSAIVSISFETDDWQGIEGQKPVINFLITPKSLKNAIL